MTPASLTFEQWLWVACLIVVLVLLALLYQLAMLVFCPLRVAWWGVSCCRRASSACCRN